MVNADGILLSGDLGVTFGESPASGLLVRATVGALDLRAPLGQTGIPCVRRPHTLGDLGSADVLLVDNIAGSSKTLAAARAAVATQALAGIRSLALTANTAR